MVRVTGETPRFAHESERVVWDLLQRQKDADWIVLANLRLTTAKKDHELDLVVLMPDEGVVVVEVKGGSVWVDEQGRWRQGNRRDNVIHPVDQARDGKYALREYVERDPAVARLVPPAHPVGPRDRLALQRLEDDFADAGLPAVDDLGQGRPRPPRRATARRRGSAGDRLPSPRRGRPRPRPSRSSPGAVFPVHDVTAEADDREAVADRLTQEQAALLKVTRLINRDGGARGRGQRQDDPRPHPGQGPDPRARASAGRSASRCSATRSGSRSTSSGSVAGVPRNHRPAFVGTFEELGQRVGSTDGRTTATTADFWERRAAGADGRARRRPA